MRERKYRDSNVVYILVKGVPGVFQTGSRDNLKLKDVDCNAFSLGINSLILMEMSKNPTLSQKIGLGCQKEKNYLQV